MFRVKKMNQQSLWDSHHFEEKKVTLEKTTPQKLPNRQIPLGRNQWYNVRIILSWWLRNAANSPIELASLWHDLQHFLQDFIHPNGGWPWAFWTIDSISYVSRWPAGKIPLLLNSEICRFFFVAHFYFRVPVLVSLFCGAPFTSATTLLRLITPYKVDHMCPMSLICWNMDGVMPGIDDQDKE